MKRNILLSFTILFFFCIAFTSCLALIGEAITDKNQYGDGPAVQGNVTITGLEAYNGKYITMYGHMNYYNEFSYLIGTTKLTKKAQFGYFVSIKEDTLDGAQITNGSVKIPYYAMSGSETVLSKTYSPPFGFLTVRIYINTEKSIIFRPCFSTENVIATAMIPVGWQDNRNFTLNKSQLVDWNDF